MRRQITNYHQLEQLEKEIANTPERPMHEEMEEQIQKDLIYAKIDRRNKQLEKDKAYY